MKKPMPRRFEQPTPMLAAFWIGAEDSEGSWEALPQRLRGRGDWLRERGRIKDAELMYDAALEIDGLRSGHVQPEGTT